MKKYLWLVGIVVVIVIVVAVSTKRSNPDESAAIKIGFVGPLSGFGAAWGEEQKWAVDTAVSEINQDGGVVGKKLEVIYEDGKCSEKDATSAAQKLISIDKVKLLFTVCGGSESLPIAPIADKNKVLQMALWSTHPDLSGISEYVFRNSYSDDDTGKMMAETINKDSDKAVIVSELEGYPQGLLKRFRKYFKGELIEKNYPPNTKDFRAYVLEIVSAKPQAVVLNPQSPEGGLILLKQLRQLGYKGPLFGTYFGAVNEVLKASEAQGMIFFSDPDVDNGSLKKALYEKYLSTHKEKPNFDFAVAVSYDSVYILKQAVEKVGTDPSKIKDYLHSLKDFHGIMGTYGFNEKGDATGYKPSIKQIKNSEAVDVAK